MVLNVMSVGELGMLPMERDSIYKLYLISL